MPIESYLAPNGATVRIHTDALVSLSPTELALRRRLLSQAMRQCGLCPPHSAPHNLIASAESTSKSEVNPHRPH